MEIHIQSFENLFQNVTLGQIRGFASNYLQRMHQVCNYYPRAFRASCSMIEHQYGFSAKARSGAYIELTMLRLQQRDADTQQ